MNSNEPGDCLEELIGDVVAIPNVNNWTDLSQNRIDVAINRLIFNLPKRFAGHGFAEDASDLIDKLF